MWCEEIYNLHIKGTKKKTYGKNETENVGRLNQAKRNMSN